MTNSSKPTAAPAKFSARQAWATVYTSLLAADIVPISISLHPNDIDVTVHLRDDNPADVDRALRLLDLPEGGPWVCSGTEANRWNEGTPREFIAYGLYSSWERSPVVAGWVVNVYCHIHTQQAAVTA